MSLLYKLSSWLLWYPPPISALAESKEKVEDELADDLRPPPGVAEAKSDSLQYPDELLLNGVFKFNIDVYNFTFPIPPTDSECCWPLNEETGGDGSWVG